MSKDEDGATMQRRRFLATAGAMGTGALAGCGSPTDTSVGKSSDKDVPAPSVDAGKRWKLRTPKSKPRVLQKGEVAFIDYQAVGHINRYEDTLLRQRIKENTFGEVDRPFSVAFCGRVDVFPRRLRR
ncbi:hypothetical protein VB779_08770 [Haloarculaceae archaeon H-GB11]|nr:hypothetical protein [Haloarculaceae archaeon H-GB11]